MAGKAPGRCREAWGGLRGTNEKALAEARRQSRNIGDKAGGWKGPWTLQRHGEVLRGANEKALAEARRQSRNVGAKAGGWKGPWTLQRGPGRF